MKIDDKEFEPTIFTLGPARFTTLSPACIRIEYSKNGCFEDDPTLFATREHTIATRHDCNPDDTELTIDTGVLKLFFTPDGKRKLSEDNLRIELPNGKTWRLGMTNDGNLGGTCRTLDNFLGEGKVGPGLLSHDGWFLIDDGPRFRGMPAGHVLKDGWVEQRPVESGSDWYFLWYGDDFRAALKLLTTVAGKVPMPRKRVLGSWYCRWWSYTAEEFKEIAAEYDKHDFPLDVMVMDMDWQRHDAKTGFGWAGNRGWTGLSWNHDLIPDPAGLMRHLHDAGVDIALNLHPHDGVRTHEDCYADFMRELAHDPADGRELPFSAGDRDYMEAYFKHTHVPHEEIGVDFWWVDWQQDALMPYTLGMPLLTHLPWLNHLYYRHSRRNGRRGMSYSRWGGWGDHRHPIHFSGDTLSSWKVLAWQVPFTAVSGNVGCFFWAHDTGGFMGDRNDELFVRWTQFCAMSASLRLHSSCSEELDRRPWKCGKDECDAARVSYHLRSRLMPYIYSTVRQCYNESLPMIRPMYLMSGEEEAFANPQQFILGEALLSAPVVAAGAGPGRVATQKVWLPEGDWYHVFSNERFSTGTHVIPSDINEFPLLVKGGYPLAMQPYRSRMGSAPLDELVVRIYPGRDGESTRATVYEDDGETEAYKNGQFAETLLTYSRDGDEIRVTVGATAGEFKGQLEDRTVCLELPCTDGIEMIESSVPVKVQDCEEGMSRIRLETTGIREEISVLLRATILDNATFAAAAFKRRAAALLGQQAESASWEDVSVDGQPEVVRAVLDQLAEREPIPCINPIEVGAPFSDPDW
ncbi:MAG: glycoside hydrolase family 31 protein [Lentisphaeria bacterium]|nr:glycoside hydrolase family 31 protein [Lentisphaeria bacterium]